MPVFAKIFQEPFLKKHIAVLPAPDKTILVCPLKLAGVIVAAKEPDVDVFKKILI